MKLTSCRALASGLVFFAPVITGCDQFCSLEARASVLIEVVDAQGRPVPGARVRSTHDGETATLQCPRRDENDVCEVWSVGSEEPGIFIVAAEAPDGATGHAVAIVGETDDGCHVETEQLRIVVE